MDNVDIMNKFELGVASIQKRKVKHGNITEAASGDVITESQSYSCGGKEKKKKLNETRTEEQNETTELWLSDPYEKRKKKGKRSDIQGTETKVAGNLTTILDTIILNKNTQERGRSRESI